MVQVGQRIVLRDTMGRHGTSLDVPVRPLGIKGWNGRRVMLKHRQYGTSLDVSLIP